MLGGLGVLFGVIGRSHGNRLPTPVSGIATGAVALVAAAVAIILPLGIVVNASPPPPPAPPVVQPQPLPPPRMNPPRSSDGVDFAGNAGPSFSHASLNDTADILVPTTWTTPFGAWAAAM